MRAFHHAKPSQLGLFAYAAVIFSGLIDWLLWNKQPSLLAYMGIILIWSIRFSQNQIVDKPK